jgi:hypothetical protein
MVVLTVGPMILVEAVAVFIVSVHLLVRAVFVLLGFARREKLPPTLIVVSKDAIGQSRYHVEGAGNDEGGDHQSHKGPTFFQTCLTS